jgi:hypothetical protein
VPLIPIPIYLSAELTGIYIDTESKNIDTDIDVDTVPESSVAPQVTQRGINSSITINALANNKSIGLNILMALIDQVFAVVTSKEYSVTYINGAITVFGGLVKSLDVTQDANTDLYRITLVLSKASSQGTRPKADPPTLPAVDGVTL